MQNKSLNTIKSSARQTQVLCGAANGVGNRARTQLSERDKQRSSRSRRNASNRRLGDW